MSGYRVVHLSDVHIPPLPALGVGDLFGKRLLGLFSWHHKWKNEHLESILRALDRALEEVAPDHICITGDLTFTTHPAEVDQAAGWLESFGPPARVSLVPGNHDAYVPGALAHALKRWAAWMLDDDSGEQRFPFLHRRGPVDIIGLCSAIAVRTPRTIGRLGEAQLERTEALLEEIGTGDRPRILLIHHPLQDGAVRRGKELLDRQRLRQLLAARPVDVVLHGHTHRPMRAVLDGPAGPVHVLGAGSASARGRRYRPAQFHLLEFTDDDRNILLRQGQYNDQRGEFELGAAELLARPVLSPQP